MEQFFHIAPGDINRAMAQRECYMNADARMQEEQRHLQGLTPAQQRAHLETHRTGTITAIGDWMRSFRESDAQAVTRMLGDLRSAQEHRCR